MKQQIPIDICIKFENKDFFKLDDIVEQNTSLFLSNYKPPKSNKMVNVCIARETPRISLDGECFTFSNCKITQF